MVDMKRFGETLRKYRKEQRMTQWELAEKLMISPQSVSIWESGKGLPDLDHLCELSKVLSVSVDVLLNQRPDGMRGLIGIDGGGTKTEFALIDETGRSLNSIVLEGSNPNVHGIEQAVDVIRRGIDFLRPGEMKVMGVCLGGAGMGGGTNGDMMRTALQKIYPELKVDCANDILNVIACCTQPDNCIAAISGTGCVVYAHHKGQLHRVGGAGYLFEGRGSGYDMGREAITAALRARDGIAPRTTLTDLVEEKLGGNPWDFIHDLYKRDVSYIASFSPLVSRAAGEGDRLAQSILEQGSEHLAKEIRQARIFAPEARHVILSGSLFVKDDRFFHAVAQRLDGDLTVERMSCPPVWGACLQCAKLCGLEKMPSQSLYMQTRGPQPKV